MVKKKKKANWIAGAIKRPGQLHADLGVPKSQKLTAEDLARAKKMGGKTAKRASLAQTFKSFRRKKK